MTNRRQLRTESLRPDTQSRSGCRTVAANSTALTVDRAASSGCWPSSSQAGRYCVTANASRYTGQCRRRAVSSATNCGAAASQTTVKVRPSTLASQRTR